MKLKVNPASVLSFLTKGVLYSRPQDVFVRELVQNSLDGITHRRALERAADFKGSVEIAYESATIHNPASVRVSDNGLGLTWDGIQTELLAPMTPFSRKPRALDPNLKNVRGEFIGRYGMGLMTGFHVADTIIITSYPRSERVGHRVSIHLDWQEVGNEGEF